METAGSASTNYGSGSERFIERLNAGLVEALALPPRLTLSEWADRFAHLSAETSADAGKFRSFAYQDGIMDAVTDPSVRQVTVIKSARVGYTKILDHVVGYFIHQDPSPTLIVQPRVEDAEDYSRTEIAPMLRDTPVLAEIAGDLKAKDSNQRILKRVFRNGASVAFVGANSPGGFRRITARIVAFDEVDGYPVAGAGNEGDQIALGIKRTESFWNRKVILGSTPTIKGMSRIEKAWNESDQRRYHVPCPHCREPQVLRWTNLRWDKDESGAHRPETAHFVCEASGCIIEEHDKPGMIDAGQWIASAPSNGHAGFHIWAAYSLFENAAWRYLVEEFLRVRNDPSLLQTFVNLVLGETWEEQGERVDMGALAGRAEAYDGDSLPDEVLAVAAGIDTQGDRLEVQLVGWGAEQEAWPFRYVVLPGDPAQPQVWKDLDALLLERFTTQAGRVLRVRAACIDSGGHHAAQVLAFCRARVNRRIFATKGIAGPRPIWPTRASRTKTNAAVFMIGVDTAKDALFGKLRIAQRRAEDNQPLATPGYVHFPALDEFDQAYFDQLTSEQVVTRYREGRPYRVWVLPKGRRNEALDTLVLALAARMSLPQRLGRELEYATRAPAETPPAHVISREMTAAKADQVRPQLAGRPKGFLPRRSGWLSRR